MRQILKCNLYENMSMTNVDMTVMKYQFSLVRLTGIKVMATQQFPDCEGNQI